MICKFRYHFAFLKSDCKRLNLFELMKLVFTTMEKIIDFIIQF